MLKESSREDYRCLIDILTCLVCKQLVEQAHICPNCSKFYCYGCISQQLRIEQHCLNCSRPLQHNMLVNCQQLCNQLRQTLQMARLRGEASPQMEKSQLYCGLHQLSKTYYCRTCHTPLCSDCSHRGHDFIKLAIVRENYNKAENDLKSQIKNTKVALLKKIETVRRGVLKSGRGGNESVSDLDYANKALREELKRSSTQMIKQSQKEVDRVISVQENWADLYEDSMKIMKQCSKGEFVEKYHLQLEDRLDTVLNGIPAQKKKLQSLKNQIFSQEKYNSYVSPDFKSYTFIIEQYSVKKKQEWFYTSSISTSQGLQWRLKVYPQGVKQAEATSLKLHKKPSKNQQYLAIFIELVSGPAPSLQKHQLVLVNQLNHTKNMIREFENQFQQGECCGYETFMRVSQLEEQGFYNQQQDNLEIILSLAPSTFYQACANQLPQLEAKKVQIRQLKLILGKQHRKANTAGLLRSSQSIDLKST